MLLLPEVKSRGNRIRWIHLDQTAFPKNTIILRKKFEKIKNETYTEKFPVYIEIEISYFFSSSELKNIKIVVLQYMAQANFQQQLL